MLSFLWPHNDGWTDNGVFRTAPRFPQDIDFLCGAGSFNEPVSVGGSLIYREITGSFAESGACGRFSGACFLRQFNAIERKFPVLRSRELKVVDLGISFTEQGSRGREQAIEASPGANERADLILAPISNSSAAVSRSRLRRRGPEA
jgi:hypothetical protein